MEENNITSLVEAAKSGNQGAFDALCELYTPLILSLCGAYVKNFESLELEIDDLKQEALIALFKAANTYHSDKKVTFGAYSKVCINNRLISYVRKQRSKQKAKLSQKEYIPPETRFIDTYNGERLALFTEKHLTSLERRVFEMYLKRTSYEDMAKSLDISKKSVDNAICRIKAKLKKFL